MKKIISIKNMALIFLILISVSLVGCSQSSDKSTKGNKHDISKSKQQNTEDMLKDFGAKYLNYNSIDGRNESIKKYFTDEAQDENSLNVKVHADIKSKGKVTGAYKDISNKNQYLLQIYQETQGSKTVAILKLTVTEGKISKMNMFYVQSAYGN
ncbi:EF0163 family protein [Streptococcus parauberis]|uniref:EF0163 family protein n=1 Tax=Streptococcus parauberis TaxID=1348 RepID=UPI0039AFEE05